MWRSEWKCVWTNTLYLHIKHSYIYIVVHVNARTGIQTYIQTQI